MGARTPGVSGSRTVGVILAAGRSERMGRPKALLKAPGPRGPETLIERSARLMKEGGVSHIVTVVNSDTRRRIVNALMRLPARLAPQRNRIAVNPDPAQGMVSSIRIGLLGAIGMLSTAGKSKVRVKYSDRLLVTLVDIPEIDPAVIRRLLKFRAPKRAWMLIPRFADGRGHPILLYRAAFDRLHTNLPRGLKSLMEIDPARILDLPVAGNQPWDVDTVEDYRGFKKRLSRK